MIIYKDLITNDELFTDSYKLREVDDGIFIEVEGKLHTECTKVDESMFGGNKSAEANDEDAEDTSVSGVNIVLQNRLAEVGVIKKKYQKYLKVYVRKLVDHLTKTKPDYVDTFKKKVQLAVKRILESFDDWCFYRGETDIDYENLEEPEGMLCILGYREDGMTPYMLFFKDGLIEEKA